MAEAWKCPVCGFEAGSKDELDKHIQKTGHVMFDDTEDKGQESPPDVDDLSFTEHTGYTPGISSGDVRDEKSDIESKERVQDGEKKKGS